LFSENKYDDDDSTGNMTTATISNLKPTVAFPVVVNLLPHCQALIVHSRPILPEMLRPLYVVFWHWPRGFVRV